MALALIDNTRGPVFPNIISEMDISASRASMLFAIASFSGLLTNITARWWLPYVNSYYAAILSLVFLGVGSILFSQSTVYGPWLLDTSSFIIGLGMGVSNIGINLLVAQATPVIHRRRFFAGLHSVYGIGSFCAPLFLNLYLLVFIGWHSFFILLAFIPFAVILSFLVFHKMPRSEVKDQKRKKLTAPCAYPTRLIFALLFGLYVSSEIVISSRLVYFLNSFETISIDQARYALSLFFLGLLTGRLSVAFIKTSARSETLLIFSIFSSLTLYLLSVFISPYFLALTGFSMSYFFPVAMDWLSNIFKDHLEYMMASVMTGISIMLVLMHVGFGYVTDLLDIRSAMVIFPALQIFCLGFIFLIKLKKVSTY